MEHQWTTPKLPPVKIGIVGCGNISDIYFQTAKRLPILEVAACADLELERAKAKAALHGIPKACTVAELLADPEIQIVVNLTIPKAHYDVCLAALHAGQKRVCRKAAVADPRSRPGTAPSRQSQEFADRRRPPIRSSAQGCKPAAKSLTTA